jgi:hypothetical protein
VDQVDVGSLSMGERLRVDGESGVVEVIR